MTKYRLILPLLLILALTSCNEYQKLLKSTDPELKYRKAIEYFEKGDYTRAQTLFDAVSGFYRGTDRSEDVLIYLARCHHGEKIYDTACEYYLSYIRNYPKGKYIMEARYMVGHCYYLNSPDPRLDQADTHKAIEYLTQFVEYYPEHQYAAVAYDEIDQMYNKLAEKEYLSAKLYYNLGTYLGNNYESAVIVAKNALKKYPGNKFQEELGWIILQAKYQQVAVSVAELRLDRARDAYDEYYSFITEYPQSKHRKAADKMAAELKKITKDS